MLKFSAALFAASLSVLALPALAQAEPTLRGGATVPSLMAPECLAIHYEPVPVYQHVNGKRLGTLKLDKPELAAKDQSSCDGRPRVVLHMKGRAAPVPVEMVEVGYDEQALSVFAVRTAESVRWVRGKAGDHYFWLPVTPALKYQSLDEDLVRGVALFDEVCTKPGECMASTTAFRKKVEDAGAANEESCQGTAYDLIDKKRGSDGRLYYQLELTEQLRNKQLNLPHQLWVPAWTRDGRWTGFFESCGC